MVQSVRPTIGKYLLGERINFGGPGEVYRANYRREQVAIRLLPATLVADPDFAPRFEHEVGRLAELDHPQIVPILGFGQHEGVPYVITPFDSGESLRDRFARNRPLPEELLGYLRQIASALDHAHAVGICHGDLGPSDVVITEEGSVLVANFGLAALCEPALTRRESDPSTDVADLARIAQSGLTGSLSATALAGAANPGLAVIRQAIAKGYASAGAFVRDLAEAQAGPRSLSDAADDSRAPESSLQRSIAPRPAPRLRLPQALVPQSATGRRIALMWVAGLLLAVIVIGGGLKVVGGRGNDGQNNAAPAPAASKASVSLVPTGDLPYDFPVDNALIARKYAEAQGRLPAEAGDGKLHRFAAECANPRAAEDCLLVYVFYSKQADQMYNYHYKIREDALIGEFVEPAQNDDYRITMEQLPWEKNPEWLRLLRESFAQLPENFAPGGFSAALVGNSAALNNGVADWTMVYVERDANRQVIFELLGDQVRKLPE